MKHPTPQKTPWISILEFFPQEEEAGPAPKKKYNLYLTLLSVSRELILRFVLFLIVYVIFTRLLKIFIGKQ